MKPVGGRIETFSMSDNCFPISSYLISWCPCEWGFQAPEKLELSSFRRSEDDVQATGSDNIWDCIQAVQTWYQAWGGGISFKQNITFRKSIGIWSPSSSQISTNTSEGIWLQHNVFVIPRHSNCHCKQTLNNRYVWYEETRKDVLCE